MSPTFAACPSATSRPLKHAWEHSKGSGHAPLALRADWQEQLRRCHDELGFRYVRFHRLLSDDMGTLIRKLVGHSVECYGIAEVRQWFFEVWNKPNLPAFWTGTQKGYFKRYAHTAQAITSIDGSLRVGGPATAMTEWVQELRDYGENNRLPVDFIGTHIYPTDPLGFEGADTQEQLANSPRELLRDRAKLVRQQARGLPVYFTEWNISSHPRDPDHDEPFAAAYAARIVLETDAFVESYSYWTFTDIFAQNYFPSTPFHGIPKPIYRAFQLLHHLGDELLPVVGVHETVDVWVVCKSPSMWPSRLAPSASTSTFLQTRSQPSC